MFLTENQSRIPGVIIREIQRYSDDRGITAELFRVDEEPNHLPELAYISLTNPETSRGPHEHMFQTDYFIFIGPAEISLTLWDNRLGIDKFPLESEKRFNEVLKTVERHLLGGEKKMHMALIPEGVIHGYRNTSNFKQAMIINLPDRLYGGFKKKEKVDEIRWEGKENNPFVLQ